MAIEILPPQLANQIAAGEVVERPASVVKELVENSLDAGATRIDIEIDKGGSKLIRIRDNGSGIAKEELALALSRHATSKLHTLDDLEAIMSFGFRGEALASISSVSRLTLTSRTAQQSEAWQAYTEGSLMAVRIIPAAHPVGSTLDVVDLFFNTPARRRFLKSDKTEFTHIDEWLKRIALVRGDIHFTLTHNGKQVRNYRPATSESQYLQRLAQVSGRSFAEQALKIDCEHDGLKLSGYLQSPAQRESVGDTHFFYVNGRLVRDRLVNHAVRQAFAELSEAQQPGYVLMLTLDPHQVDVNVHPAKHEVRFHQARYIHDYILQALQSALSQLSELSLSKVAGSESPGWGLANGIPAHLDGQSALAQRTAREGRDYDYRAGGGLGPGIDAGKQRASYQERRIAEDTESDSQSDYRLHSMGMGQGREPRLGDPQPSRSALASYGALLSTVPDACDEPPSEHVTDPMPALLQGQYWLLVAEDRIRLLEVKAVALVTRQTEIAAKLATGLIGQPLLMPVSVAADPLWDEILQIRETLLRQLGLELTIRYRQLIIKKVPPYLRDSQLARVIPELLQWLQFEVPTPEALTLWLAKQSITGFVSAPLIWSAYCQLDETARQATLLKAKVLPWQQWLEEDASE